MSEGFPITLQPGKFVRNFLYSQIFGTPPVPTKSFAGQTVIITGSNVGLGLEAARHVYNLNCAKLILAVRTVSKGESAREYIVQNVKHRTDPDAIEVWPLDLTSTESTLAFAERVKNELPRVDVLIENAGVNNRDWAVSEGFEQNIQVNVVNTFLLALSLLPKLRETKIKFTDAEPHLVIVSSEGHRMTKFPDISAANIYERLNDEKSFNGNDRYFVSKLLEVLFVRELVARIDSGNASAAQITINMVNPGLCVSTLDRNASAGLQLVLSLLRFAVARSTEVGSRTLVHGASAEPESHGEFMDDGHVSPVESWIYGDVGRRAQTKVFEQTMKVLEARKPGIGAVV
jgi:retinol dehydrogenase-12